MRSDLLRDCKAALRFVQAALTGSLPWVAVRGGTESRELPVGLQLSHFLRLVCLSLLKSPVSLHYGAQPSGNFQTLAPPSAPAGSC